MREKHPHMHVRWRKILPFRGRPEICAVNGFVRMLVSGENMCGCCLFSPSSSPSSSTSPPHPTSRTTSRLGLNNLGDVPSMSGSAHWLSEPLDSCRETPATPWPPKTDGHSTQRRAFNEILQARHGGCRFSKKMCDHKQVKPRRYVQMCPE